MNLCKRIFIMGHPGAGKALAAKTLAKKLGWEFINSDLGLEMRIGRTIPEILGKEGEMEFQNREFEIVSSLLLRESIVVTTDASIICNKKIRHLLSSEFAVFLNASTPVQIERTSRNDEPLLPASDLKGFFDRLHTERDDLYKEVASTIINSDNSALENHVLLIMSDAGLVPGTAPMQLERKETTLFHKNMHTPVHLSKQQATCLKLLTQGKAAKEIAREMNISFRTVDGTIAKLMDLTGCTSSKELIGLYFD